MKQDNKVYCEDCIHRSSFLPGSNNCEHDNNKEWYWTEGDAIRKPRKYWRYRRSPIVINQHNDCQWFKEYSWAGN